MTIHFNCTGERRKELVHAIAEILECDSRYLGMPTQAYSVGSYTVSKTGELTFDDSNEVEQLIEALCERGFEAEVSIGESKEDGTKSSTRNEDSTAADADTENCKDSAAEAEDNTVTGLCISYPRSKISDAGIERLKKLLEAKETLIQKALGVNALPVEIDDEKASFPWFDTLPEPDEVAAYSRFLCALCSFAEHQKRITCKAAEVENEKYAFRCFLLRLGFIGDSYDLKQARKILLSKLSGSGAFRKPREAVIPTPENTVRVDVTEALERLQDPQVQEEIKTILNEKTE